MIRWMIARYSELRDVYMSLMISMYNHLAEVIEEDDQINNDTLPGTFDIYKELNCDDDSIKTELYEMVIRCENTCSPCKLQLRRSNMWYASTRTQQRQVDIYTCIGTSDTPPSYNWEISRSHPVRTSLLPVTSHQSIQDPPCARPDPPPSTSLFPARVRRGTRRVA